MTEVLVERAKSAGDYEKIYAINEIKKNREVIIKTVSF